MVELIKHKIQEKYEISSLKFVEYGCGSGAIGLSMIKEFDM